MKLRAAEANLIARTIANLDVYERGGYRRVSELQVFDRQGNLIGRFDRTPGEWIWVPMGDD